VKWSSEFLGEGAFRVSLVLVVIFEILVQNIGHGRSGAARLC